MRGQVNESCGVRGVSKGCWSKILRPCRQVRRRRQITKSDVSVDLSPALRISMEPVLQSIKALPLKIREYNRKIVEP